MASESIDFQLALQAAKEAANRGREILKKYFGNLSNVDEKHQAGLVTEADVNSEKAIISFLKGEFPNLGFLAEESSYLNSTEGQQSHHAGRWIIDPLDGTTNFVHRFPIFCISIGLEWKNEIVVGLIDVPILNDTYWAIKGQGAFKNGKPIHVSHTAVLKEALLATGFSVHKPNALEQQLQIFTHLIRESRGVRRAGAAAFDLCMVAEGIFDVFWERDLSPWDVAAGALIVREAGGTVTDFSGQRHTPYMPNILASGPNIHQTMVNHIGSVSS
ncbi:MAG: inositol monophosphatase [Pseudobdellovibrionaceae bacterium]|nr:MAG: inositol monophosphatase [Pseudobdellovibrionaceae bacterium]